MKTGIASVKANAPVSAIDEDTVERCADRRKNSHGFIMQIMRQMRHGATRVILCSLQSTWQSKYLKNNIEIM